MARYQYTWAAFTVSHRDQGVVHASERGTGIEGRVLDALLSKELDNQIRKVFQLRFPYVIAESELA